jgi:acetamidase/formamidase
MEPRERKMDRGHALCGPIAVRGAKRGTTLDISIDAIEPGPWGWTRSGGWKSPVNDRLGVADGAPTMLVWAIDAKAGVARDQNGHEVTIRPFMGVIGMPPADAGNHSTIPPRTCGGNLDCRELVAGSRLWLPVTVPNALLSVGDGHAAQGDGEVSGLAIECPMERVDLTITAIDRPGPATPIAMTPAGSIALGVGATLDEAAGHALEGMLEIMKWQHHLERREALALASVVVDLRVTQIVNDIVGVHAVLPTGALRQAGVS